MRSPTIERVVVTGGSGRIGRYLLRELRADYDVVNADLVRDDSGVRFEHVDVMDLERLRLATRSADAVCHVAGIDFDREAAPEEVVRVNILGSWHVLQACAENRVKKVVLTSSVSACGLSEMRAEWQPQYLPIDEDHPCQPVQAYSVSKHVIEQMGLSFAHGTKMRVICLRPMAVVLPESLAEYVASVEQPDLRWLFYYVAVNDVARAFSLALAAEEPRYGVFFLGAADTSRPEPTLEWYTRRVGPLPEVVDFGLYDKHPRASLFSSARARNYLGWEPTSDYLELRSRADPPIE